MQDFQKIISFWIFFYYFFLFFLSCSFFPINDDQKNSSDKKYSQSFIEDAHNFIDLMRHPLEKGSCGYFDVKGLKSSEIDESEILVLNVYSPLGNGFFKRYGKLKTKNRAQYLVWEYDNYSIDGKIFLTGKLIAKDEKYGIGIDQDNSSMNGNFVGLLTIKNCVNGNTLELHVLSLQLIPGKNYCGTMKSIEGPTKEEYDYFVKNNAYTQESKEMIRSLSNSKVIMKMICTAGSNSGYYLNIQYTNNLDKFEENIVKLEKQSSSEFSTYLTRSQSSMQIKENENLISLLLSHK